MDKIQPLIVHRFWIILGIALLVPLIGWWMKASELSAEISSRFQAVDGAFSSIPGGDTPNPKWKDGLEELNQDQSERLNEAIAYLWRQQQPLHVWPSSVAEDVKRVPYRGEVSNLTLQKYRRDYVKELERVWHLADPYLSDTKTGKLVIDPKYLMYANFDNAPPTSEEMYDAQEETWLTAALLEALARVNAGATSHGDAPIKEVSELKLMGGTGEPGNTSGAAFMAGIGGMSEMLGLEDDGFGYGTSGGGSPTKRAMTHGTAPVAFSPSDEFGPESEQASDSGATATGAYVDNDAASSLFGFAAKNRYVHDVDAYKTRGFYMVLVMDHRKVPDLIAELSASPWPARVARIHQSDIVKDRMDLYTGAAAGNRPSSTFRSMQPAGGGMGNLGDLASMLPSARGGGGGGGSLFSGFSAGASYSGTDADKDDPYLVNVAVSGLLTIFKPPPSDVVIASPADGAVAPAANGQLDVAPAVSIDLPADPSSELAEPVMNPATGDADAAGIAPSPAETSVFPETGTEGADEGAVP